MKETAALRSAPSGISKSSWLSQALHNKIIAVVLMMIVAVPLFAAPADYSLTGIASLTLETSALLLLSMMLWRAKWDLRPESLRTFATTSSNAPVLLLLGWVTLSCFLASQKIFGIQYLLQIGAGAMLYFAVAYQFRQSKHLSLLADVLLGLSLVVALGGMAQYQLADEQRASALFGNAQPLGSFLMLLLPIITSLALGDKNARRKVIAQITLVLMVGCLLLTQTRGAWLGAAAGLGMLALLNLRVSERARDKADSRRRSAEGSALSWKARKSQFVLPGVLAVIAVGFALVMNSQNANVMQRAATATQLNSDFSLQSRVQDSWHGALAMIAQRPLMGWGAGQFPFYQKAFTNVGADISPTGTGLRVSLAEQAHSFYLQTAAELGLIGLALMLAVLGFFWVSAWRRIPQMEAGIRRTLLLASMAASAGFAVDAFASPSWQYAQNSMFLWLILGIGTTCLRPRMKAETETTVHKYVASRRMSWIGRPAAVCTFLLMATLLPTTYSSAASFGYNNNNSRGDRAFNIAYGVAAFTGVFYLAQSLFGGGSGGDSNRDETSSG